MCNITINRLQLVKETAKRYEFSKQITSNEKAAKIFNAVFHLNESANEQCCAIFTDSRLKLVAAHAISTGTLDSAVVDIAGVFKVALLCNAYGFFIAHNHPSGSTLPSQEDIDVTKRLQQAGEILGIKLIDHLIIGNNDEYCSLYAKGFLLDE